MSSRTTEECISEIGGVVDIRNSACSLYSPRKPTTETPAEEAVEIRRIPLNESGKPGKNSSRNCARCPTPGKSRKTGSPIVDPSMFVNSNVIVTGEVELLVTAMPLRMLPGWPLLPDDST